MCEIVYPVKNIKAYHLNDEGLQSYDMQREFDSPDHNSQKISMHIHIE